MSPRPFWTSPWTCFYTILDRTLERRQVAGLEAQIKRRIARANAPTPAA
jgi:hypothetical protein